MDRHEGWEPEAGGGHPLDKDMGVRRRLAAAWLTDDSMQNSSDNRRSRTTASSLAIFRWRARTRAWRARIRQSPHLFQVWYLTERWYSTWCWALESATASSTYRGVGRSRERWRPRGPEFPFLVSRSRWPGLRKTWRSGRRAGGWPYLGRPRLRKGQRHYGA